jgi:hypothetical protein
MDQPVPSAPPTTSRSLTRSILGAALFAPAFAIACAGIVAARMLLAGQAAGGRFATVTAVVFVATAAAGFAGWVLAAAFAGDRPASARFATMLILLVAGTAGFIAFGQYLAFMLGERIRTEEAEFPSLRWVLLVVGGGPSAVYVTIAIALRLLLPVGLVPLLAGAALFARHGDRRAG